MNAPYGSFEDHLEVNLQNYYHLSLFTDYIIEKILPVIYTAINTFY